MICEPYSETLFTGVFARSLIERLCVVQYGALLTLGHIFKMSMDSVTILN